MKLYDGGKIIPGILLFFTGITFPMWYNFAKGAAGTVPEPKITISEKRCVAPKEIMRATHMELLNEWRDRVVRHNQRFFITVDGRRYEMSLCRTCMNCHANKKEFCDSCHNYVGVDPYCWNCHVEPKEGNQ